jgi:hypothetical protein
MLINDIKFNQTVKFSRDVKYFTELTDVSPIRSNTIIYKTITGLGATYSEIVAERQSIIVLPNISIVKNKADEHNSESFCHDVFAVYGDISIDQILAYLVKPGNYKKFLTTPQGVSKIISAVNRTNMRGKTEELFFLLIDECHRVIQEANYREDMIEVMELFFQFENKAMISATPLPPSDPRFGTVNKGKTR